MLWLCGSRPCSSWRRRAAARSGAEAPAARKSLREVAVGEPGQPVRRDRDRASPPGTAFGRTTVPSSIAAARSGAVSQAASAARSRASPPSRGTSGTFSRGDGSSRSPPAARNTRSRYSACPAMSGRTAEGQRTDWRLISSDFSRSRWRATRGRSGPAGRERPPGQRLTGGARGRDASAARRRCSRRRSPVAGCPPCWKTRSYGHGQPRGVDGPVRRACLVGQAVDEPRSRRRCPRGTRD